MVSAVKKAVARHYSTVFTLPHFFFSVEPVASKFRTQVLMACSDGTVRLQWIPNSSKFTMNGHKTVTDSCKTLLQQKQLVLQSMAPLQLKRFKVGSKMAIEASTPVCRTRKKLNVYLPSLRMKVPDRVYVLGHTYTCYTYCCYAYNFYAYRLYFINVWHVYEWPKIYTWSGTFILKDGRYTFTFFFVSLPLPQPVPTYVLT
jgi:hypothetical protein